MNNVHHEWDLDQLLKICRKIDGNGYGAARNLIGLYTYDDGYQIAIENVPRDPFDPVPGYIRLIIPHNILQYNVQYIVGDNYRKMAAEHFFTEMAYRTLRYEGKPWLNMDRPGQAVLERTSIIVTASHLELLLHFIPPYKGKRKISGGRLRHLFSNTIPRLVDNLKATNKKKEMLRNLGDTVTDQEYLRNKLREEGYIAFIADGSVLPRRGETDQPLSGAIPFKAPARYATVFDLPFRGKISGLAIRAGEITVFAGANFHGKTTILEALSVAHYNHIPGDGREFVISVRELPLISVENRRIVRGVDISFFMQKLPENVDVSNFTTNAASGSTSQAATLLEALEFGVPGMLIDEDSSAVNLLLKDPLLREIVPSDLEPITPLIDNVDLIRHNNVSIIFAIGALGAFLRKADTIFLVSNFRVSDILMHEEKYIIKEEIKKSSARPNNTGKVSKPSSLVIKQRVPETNTIPYGTLKELSRDEIVLMWRGRRVNINLRGPIRRTLKEIAQVRALGLAVSYASKYADGRRTLREIVNQVMHDINTHGLHILNPYEDRYLNLAKPTAYQLFYALSRLPTLKIKNL